MKRRRLTYPHRFHAKGDDPHRDFRRACRHCGEGPGHPLHLLPLPGFVSSYNGFLKTAEEPEDEQRDAYATDRNSPQLPLFEPETLH